MVCHHIQNLLVYPHLQTGWTLQENCIIIIISPIPGELQWSLWCYWYSVPQCKPFQCSIIPELPVCQVRKWPCCSDETNIHRNVVFLPGVNLSRPSSMCTSYGRPWELPLGSRDHCCYRKKKKLPRWIPALNRWGPNRCRTGLSYNLHH